MGVKDNVGHDVFPRQGSLKGRPVRVTFNDDVNRSITGTCVRDDVESPWTQIFALSDGRYVLSVECQYQEA